MVRSVTRWISTTAVAILVAACAGAPASTTNAPTATVSLASPAASMPQVGWFDPLEEAGEEAEEPLPSGTSMPGPDGVALNTPGPALEPGIEDSEVPTVPEVDPCTLISADEWTTWTGDPSASPTLIEGGEACGWRNADDTLRAAVGVVLAGGQFEDGEYIAERVDGEYIPEVGDWGAVWRDGWPTPQSSTLVIYVGTSGVFEALLEVSARGAEQTARLRETALHFAPMIAGRVP